MGAPKNFYNAVDLEKFGLNDIDKRLVPAPTAADNGKIAKVSNGEWSIGVDSTAPVRISGEFNQDYTTFTVNASTFDEFKSMIHQDAAVFLHYNLHNLPVDYGYDGYIPYAYWSKENANSDDIFVFSGPIVMSDGTEKNVTITFTGSIIGVVTINKSIKRIYFNVSIDESNVVTLLNSIHSLDIRNALDNGDIVYLYEKGPYGSSDVLYSISYDESRSRIFYFSAVIQLPNGNIQVRSIKIVGTTGTETTGTLISKTIT